MHIFPGARTRVRVWAWAAVMAGTGLVSAAAETPRTSSAASAPAVPPAISDKDTDPMPHDWQAPVYPPEAIAAGKGGMVTIALVVDVEGRVVDPTVVKSEKVDPRLSDAALAAARTWIFSPAREAGKPVARALEVPVQFLLKGRGNRPGVVMPLPAELLAPTTPPRRTFTPDPEYPADMLPRKLAGQVEFVFEVNPEGLADNIQVKYANDAGFVMAGLETMRRWKFEPARQGPLAVRAPMESPMEFTPLDTKTEDTLAANGVRGLAAAGLDQPPEEVQLFAPVYPTPRRLAGETGDAEVEFEIDENGRAGKVAVLSASQPEFGAALAAAVETWRFRPVQKNGRPALATLQVEHHFMVSDLDPEARLVAALQPGGAGVAGAKGLDRKLRPLWRVAPVYPETLRESNVAGEAIVEFVIDQQGRVQLPRVTSASNEAFGYAAAQALSQWVFEVPLRDGQPTDVRVSIPMEFNPQKTDAAKK